MMSNDEKYNAILERIKQTESDFEPQAISMMVIIGYLQKLVELGVIESEFKVTDKGDAVMAICEEFDWKPSDQEVFDFVSAMVPKEDQLAFAFLIKRYRDDREALLAEWKGFQKSEKKS